MSAAPKIAFDPNPAVSPVGTTGLDARAAMAAFGHVLLLLPRVCWMAIDVAIVICGLFTSEMVLREYGWGHWDEVGVWQTALVLCPIVLLAGLLLGLYEEETFANRSHIIVRTLLTSILTVCLGYAVISMMLYATWSRRIALCALLWYTTLSISLRVAAGWVMRSYRCGLLLIGGREDAWRLRQMLAGERLSAKYRMRELAETETGGEAAEQIEAAVLRGDISEIVVLSGQVGREPVMNAALGCLRHGCRVTDEVTFVEKTLHRVPVDRIRSDWFLFADLQTYRREQATLKRMVDIAVSVVGLLALIPLLPLVAVVIKLDSRGPVFYWQDRVGLNGKVFRLFKLRTMADGAEENGAVWSHSGDQRVTRVGKLLRRTRLDELPQLWNILRGQMSLVGPRPERPEFVARLAQTIPFYEQRHLVKPGLTGWAQTNYGYGSSVGDAVRKLEYDLYYIKHMSLELDLAIVFRTTWALLRAEPGQVSGAKSGILLPVTPQIAH